MTEEKNKNLEVQCPHCGAELTVDVELGKVIDHKARKQSPNIDLDKAAELLKAQEARREELFAQSTEDMKTRSQLLERKFEERLQKSKEEPDKKPLRDIDLD